METLKKDLERKQKEYGLEEKSLKELESELNKLWWVENLDLDHYLPTLL